MNAGIVLGSFSHPNRPKVVGSLPDIGFTLTDDLNYYTKWKRLSNLNYPTQNNDRPTENCITLKKKCNAK